MGEAQHGSRIRLVIADDHPLVLGGLVALLQAHPEFEVVARCGSGTEAIAATRQHRPDVLVLDLQMPDRDGLSVARELQGLTPPPKIVLLTAHIHEDQMIESLSLGVSGVVLKEMATKLLVQCLHRVNAGGQWLEKESVTRAMAKLVRREAKAREVAALLTPREIEIARLAAQDYTNKQIAEKLFIAEGTVKIHLHNTYEKIGAKRRTELVRFAQDHGLV